MTPDESRQALKLVTAAAVSEALPLVSALDINELVAAVPIIVGHYSEGSAALAADHYDDLRAVAAPRQRYTAEPIVNLREERIRRGALWAVKADEPAMVAERLGQVVQLETARPYRDTITVNQQRDPAAVGWRRNTSSDGCKFCRMLASRGAVYRQSTAHFASHPHCSCTASPVFGGEAGPEASVLQYVASQRRRSESQRRALRAYLATLPD